MFFNWKKIVLVTFDLMIAAYLAAAVVLFNKPNEKGMLCRKVDINITDNVVDGFLNADEVKILLKNKDLYPLAIPVENIDCREIEDALEASPFVDHAECYKTQGGDVNITLTQRMPIIRVMAENGDDYYIDNNGGIMRNTKYTTDIIIATGHISHMYARLTLRNLGNYIVHDKFWQNQIEQINVLNDGSVELVPRVGEHIIYIGLPVHVNAKLTRLRTFYKYGLSQAGWNKYDRINVEFSNQIICKRRNYKPEETKVVPVAAAPVQKEKKENSSEMTPRKNKEEEAKKEKSPEVKREKSPEVKREKDPEAKKEKAPEVKKEKASPSKDSKKKNNSNNKKNKQSL